MAASDLHRMIASYVDGEVSLFDLYDWTIARAQYWASLPTADPSSQAANSILLAVFELDAGDRDEDSVKEIARDALAELAAAERV